MFYAAASLYCNAAIDLPADHAERAAYVVEVAVGVEGRTFGEGTLLLFTKGESVRLQATLASVALLGGAPLEGERHIWWNFVASSQERIERARRDWVDGKLAKVPGETESSRCRKPSPYQLSPQRTRRTRRKGRRTSSVLITLFGKDPP